MPPGMNPSRINMSSSSSASPEVAKSRISRPDMIQTCLQTCPPGMETSQLEVTPPCSDLQPSPAEIQPLPSPLDMPRSMSGESGYCSSQETILTSPQEEKMDADLTVLDTINAEFLSSDVIPRFETNTTPPNDDDSSISHGSGDHYRDTSTIVVGEQRAATLEEILNQMEMEQNLLNTLGEVDTDTDTTSQSKNTQNSETIGVSNVTTEEETMSSFPGEGYSYDWSDEKQISMDTMLDDMMLSL